MTILLINWRRDLLSGSLFLHMTPHSSSLSFDYFWDLRRCARCTFCSRNRAGTRSMVSDPEQLREVKALLEVPGLGCAGLTAVYGQRALWGPRLQPESWASSDDWKGRPAQTEPLLGLCIKQERPGRITTHGQTEIRSAILSKALSTQDKGGPEGNYKKKKGKKTKIADIFFSVQYDVCNLGQSAQ